MGTKKYLKKKNIIIHMYKTILVNVKLITKNM